MLKTTNLLLLLLSKINTLTNIFILNPLYRSLRGNVSQVPLNPVICVRNYPFILTGPVISLGREDFWLLTMGVIILTSFVGAIWGDDKWIKSWVAEPGYNDPQEFAEYKHTPPKPELEQYDPEAEELEKDLTWWEKWEEFWYSQWWWPREEESSSNEEDLEPPTPLPFREKDTRTWLVRWLDNATAELCKAPPKPKVKEEDVFDDMWDWVVSVYTRATAQSTKAPSGNDLPPLPIAPSEDDEFEPETWQEIVVNFMKDRFWWDFIFGVTDIKDDWVYPSWYHENVEDDDDEADESEVKTPPPPGYFNVAEEEDDSDGDLDDDTRWNSMCTGIYLTAVIIILML